MMINPDSNPVPGTVLVPVPSVPTDDGTPAQWDLYFRAVAINNDVILRSASVAGQAANTAAINRSAQAQEYLLASYNSPMRSAKPTQEQLVWDALRGLPEVTGLSDLNITDLAKKRVEDYLKRFPNAIELD